jgi:hypothetical protein
MISWKRSLDILNAEKETAEKKKQALNGLLSTGRISQSTHDMFSMEIEEALSEIERQQKALLQKMNAKIAELGEQVKTLEILLADFEIQHVTGEIDEETYQREINVLSIGLETSRLELNSVKDAADRLASGKLFTSHSSEQQTPKISMEQEESQQPKVEFERNEAGSTEPSETELQRLEGTQSTGESAEQKGNQKA